MRISEIMTRDPACCTPDSTLQDVARMMEQNDCGCIPVVNSLSDMRPVGTITDRDITIRTVAASQNPINMKASDIMTSNIATVKPEMSVEECFDVMEDREIRRVLVVDEQGKCCGIVAQADVVQSEANPIRTNKVIREISESAPSRNPQTGTGGQLSARSSRSDSSDWAFMSSDTLVPLFVGLGAGVALTYLLNSRRGPQRSFPDDISAYSFGEENQMGNAGQANFGKYADAELEVEKRQLDLEGRLRAARTDSNQAVNEGSQTLDNDDASVHNKGRTAHQR